MAWHRLPCHQHRRPPGRGAGAAFASALTSAVLAGNGVKKPLGLLYAADVTRVPSLSASTVTSDALIDMTTAIPAPLLAAPANSAPVFLMNRVTTGVVRKLRNAVDEAAARVTAARTEVAAVRELADRLTVELAELRRPRWRRWSPVPPTGRMRRDSLWLP